MGTSSNLSSIIKYYAEKQNSPFIDFKEFSIWIKKYAEKKVEEQADLVKYLGDPSGTLTAELQGLAEKHIAAIIDSNNKKVIPVSIFAGAIMMLLVDMLARSLAPNEIPLSVITGILGTPLFIFSIYKKRKEIQ